MTVTAVILGAGQGTRMKSDLPKMLHTICGKPMLAWAVSAAAVAAAEVPVLVLGHDAERVQASIPGQARFVIQAEQLGTGHAVRQAEPQLRGRTDHVLVTYGDMPLLRGTTLQRLVETQQANSGPMSMLTVMAESPRGFGRVLRAADGTVAAIVEEAAATPEQLQIKELNVGAYCFRADWLWQALERIQRNPHKGEYFLTDTVALAVADGGSVRAVVLEDRAETIGINSRVHLAEAEAAMRTRLNQAHMLNGVTMLDPATTYIEADVRIGRDTTLMPNTALHGATEIGEGSVIGPGSIIRDSKIGKRCSVLASVVEGAVVEEDVEIGPFCHLRKGAHLGRHVHLGNFGEVKDSHLAEGVKMGHFSYIGNATIGANTNIGAGTITCNFDGEKKNPTVIGEDAFIGSDSMLVAPLKIGDRARTGAGAVVTRDVPADTLAVGMPARAIKRLDRKAPKD